MRVLIVDDNPMILPVIQPALRTVNAKHHLAKTAAKAIEYLGRKTVDLAILDYHLPDGTGMDICDVIRAHPTMADIPVMIMSSDDRIGRDVAAEGQRNLFFCDKLEGAELMRETIRALCETVQTRPS